jgi:cation transport regulator
MPYKQIAQLPDNVKDNVPKHAQQIYKEAFNSAEEQYGEEDRAHRVAWSASAKSTSSTSPLRNELAHENSKPTRGAIAAM